MTIEIATVGTERFYSSVYSYSKVEDMKNYVEDVWNVEIEDGSGSYEATFSIYDSNAVSIPEDSLCYNYNECGDIWDRLDDADTWLGDEFSDYEEYDVILIVDYWDPDDDGTGDGGDNNSDMWGASQEVAGTSTNKCSIVDVDAVEHATGARQYEGSEGIAAHEILHMFIDDNDSEHYPKIDAYGRASLMYDTDIAHYCLYDASIDNVEKSVSSCTQSKVRRWIDDNM